MYDKELDQWEPGAHAGTFRGNQLAMAAGIATLRYVLENCLVEHAASMGDRLMSHLSHIQSESRCIGEVRGRGLMIGVEIINPEAKADERGKYPVHLISANRIQAECLSRGLIVETGGRFDSVVRFLPPLIVTADQIDSISEIFQASVKAAEKQVLPTLSKVC